MTSDNTFKELSKIDVSQHTNKKMGLTYLSWVWAWQQIKNIDPNATKNFTKFQEYDFNNGKLTGRTVDYMLTDQGAYVECTVKINGHEETETLYVMDNRNKPIKLPDIGQINKAKQRCFVKAVALHGLGLYIYAGEDLPTDEDSNQKVNAKQSKGISSKARENLVTVYRAYEDKVGTEKAKLEFNRIKNELGAQGDLTDEQNNKVRLQLNELLSGVNS